MKRSVLSRTFKLNRDVIMSKCDEMNTTISEESRKLGYASGYIGQCIGRGCNMVQLKAICSVFGLSEDEVLLKEVVEEQKHEEVETTTFETGIIEQLTKMNNTLDDIANCFAVMAKLYERAWIDKE